MLIKGTAQVEREVRFREAGGGVIKIKPEEEGVWSVAGSPYRI